MRSRLCRVCGEFHPLEHSWPSECLPHWGTVTVQAPSIRPDGMDPIRSMADGKTYDGRSAYYASVKRAGCEIVGDDRGGYGKPPTADRVIPSNIQGDIKRAIAELRSR